MNRRTFLGAGGLLVAGVAGCVAREDPPGAGEPGTDSPTTDRTTTLPSTVPPTGSSSPSPTSPTDSGTSPGSFGRVEPTVDAVQPGVVYLTTPDSIGVMDDLAGAEQFLYLSVDAGSPAPPRSAVSLRFDGKSYSPVGESPRGFSLWRTLQSSPYPEDSDGGWLLFAVPHTSDASDVALTWPGGEWPLPGPARQRLATRAPPMSVTFEAPETLPAGADPTPTVSVTNEGSTVGRFVGALNRIGPSVAHAPIAAITMDVPAGETVTRTVDDSFYHGATPGGDDYDARYIFRWRGGKIERTLDIVEA